jgi:hypothetical protein
LTPKVPRVRNLGSVDQAAVEQKSSSGIASAPFVTEFSFSRYHPMKPLAHELINALAELDAKIPGLGLYAANEYQAAEGKLHPYWKTEWNLALFPRLKSLGYKLITNVAFEQRRKYVGLFQPIYTSVRFMTPEGKTCDLRLIRTSMVKVRRYGSGYHMDRRVDFDHRWAQLKMDRQIRQIWWPERYSCHSMADLRMVLFLGFDKANRPFHAQMTELEKTGHAAEHNVTFKSKSWPDTYGRDFNILTACWATTEEKT